MPTPTPENATYACVGALVDELVRSGVGHLCLCPGSRSAPLAICAARHPGLRVWALIDERSTGFFALGMARALRKPVAVLSTSGTAAANFLPAVVEARYGRIPLVVLTADRPREMRDFGASQTIDQVRLYGSHVKWFADVASPEATAEMLRYFRTVAGRAAATACERPAGPVHLNVPLREPLVPTPVPGEVPPEELRTATAWEGRPDGRPYTSVIQPARTPGPELIRSLTDHISQTPRGVIVCGPSEDPGLAEAVCRLAGAAGYPILADPLSQVRCGPHDRHLVIDGYDPMLRVDALAQGLAPDVILRLGGVPASRPLLNFLQRHSEARRVVADGEDGWTDPTHLASEVVHTDARVLCEVLASSLRRRDGTPSGDGTLPPTTGGRPARGAAGEVWAARWTRLSAIAREAVQRRLQALDEPFEGKVFAELSELLPDGAILCAGNSMPVRDLDAFFPASSRAIRVLGNRGASGIDGLISSALGAAAVSPGPVALVLGDLAFYHDMNGLLAAKLHRLRATIVLLNNDGGGIFSFLPQAAYPEHFERLFGTPTGLDFGAAASLYGAAFTRAETWQAFREGVRASLASPTVSVVEVQTTRDRNVALHQEVWAAVEAALRPELPLVISREAS